MCDGSMSGWRTIFSSAEPEYSGTQTGLRVLLDLAGLTKVCGFNVTGLNMRLVFFIVSFILIYASPDRRLIPHSATIKPNATAYKKGMSDRSLSSGIIPAKRASRTVLSSSAGSSCASATVK